MMRLSTGCSKLCATISAVLLMAGCQPRQQEFAKLPAGLPDEQSDSVRVVAMTGNKVDYILEADHTDRYYKEKMLYAKMVRVVNYSEKDSTHSTLTCDNAEMNEVENTLTALGDVIIVSDNGRMRTDKLVWFRNTDSLYAEGKVIIIRGQDIWEGFGLKTNINLDRIELNNVTATGVVDEKKLDW